MNLIKERKTRKYEFRRDKISIFLQLAAKKSSQNLGDITDGVSHFLCPENQVWLPSERYPITLEEKRSNRMKIVVAWTQGLKDGIYSDRADIARKIGCSRAWVTRVLNQL